MTEKQYMRLRFLKDYLEQIETLKKTHDITLDDYRSEIKWLEARITELENEVFPEVIPLRESPEMRSMRESAEDFFTYCGGLRKC